MVINLCPGREQTPFNEDGNEKGGTMEFTKTFVEYFKSGGKFWDLFTIIWAYIIGLFSVRIYKIVECLYQSGHLHNSRRALLLANITRVVDLEGEFDEITQAEVTYWPIEDGDLPDLLELWDIAVKINDWTNSGVNVLVHCQGGVNRSSLINGCVLYLKGYRGKQIVEKIRKGRPGALTNWKFREYLESLILNNPKLGNLLVLKLCEI